MSEESFRLLPFGGDASEHPWNITAHLSRRAGRLTVRCDLSGNLEEIRIPPPAAAPLRRDGLWEGTCFECFLAPRGMPGYWELNLSPAKHWNVYRFEDYRQNMREETAVTSLPFSVQQERDSLHVVLELDLSSILEGEPALDAGVSAVILKQGGRLTHYALVHPGQQPDFHRRDGFIASLTP